MKIYPNIACFEKYMELHNLSKEQLSKQCNLTVEQLDAFLYTGRIDFVNMNKICNATGLEVCDIYYRVPEKSDLQKKNRLN